MTVMSDQTSTSLNTRTSRSTSSSTSSMGSSYRLESVGEPEVEEMVVPSLGLEELEGRIHSYEGPLEYRALGKLGALKGWKKRWFRIAAGMIFYCNCFIVYLVMTYYWIDGVSKFDLRDKCNANELHCSCTVDTACCS